MTDYRVDDLARAAGTTARNVRLYQERGLLPPPRREGRLGWYDDSHLARLRLITRLLERGFSLGNIAELLATWESGRDLSNVLGVEQVLTMPWNDEDPAPVTMSGLREAFGAEFGAAEADRLVEIGLLRRHGARYELPSPALLGVAHELVAAGLPIRAVLRLAETLVNHLTAVARDFIVTTTEALGGPTGPSGELSAEEVEQMAKLADRLRPLATLAVTRGFSVAMDRASAELLDVAIATPPRTTRARPGRGSR